MLGTRKEWICHVGAASICLAHLVRVGVAWEVKATRPEMVLLSLRAMLRWSTKIVITWPTCLMDRTRLNLQRARAQRLIRVTACGCRAARMMSKKFSSRFQKQDCCHLCLSKYHLLVKQNHLNVYQEPK